MAPKRKPPVCAECGLPEDQPIHRYYPDGPHTHAYVPPVAKPTVNVETKAK